MGLSVEDFDFASLTAAERLQLAQELLDSVFDEVSPSTSARETAAPFSPEQMAELRRRASRCRHWHCCRGTVGDGSRPPA